MVSKSRNNYAENCAHQNTKIAKHGQQIHCNFLFRFFQRFILKRSIDDIAVNDSPQKGDEEDVYKNRSKCETGIKHGVHKVANITNDQKNDERPVLLHFEQTQGRASQKQENPVKNERNFEAVNNHEGHVLILILESVFMDDVRGDPRNGDVLEEIQGEKAQNVGVALGPNLLENGPGEKLVDLGFLVFDGPHVKFNLILFCFLVCARGFSGGVLCICYLVFCRPSFTLFQLFILKDADVPFLLELKHQIEPSRIQRIEAEHGKHDRVKREVENFQQKVNTRPQHPAEPGSRGVARSDNGRQPLHKAEIGRVSERSRESKHQGRNNTEKEYLKPHGKAHQQNPKNRNKNGKQILDPVSNFQEKFGVDHAHKNSEQNEATGKHAHELFFVEILREVVAEAKDDFIRKVVEDAEETEDDEAPGFDGRG